MPSDWKQLTWGDLATLEYGKGLRGYQDADGLYPVYGTNGQIGWHTDPLAPGPGVIIGRKGAYRGVHFSENPFFVIDTAFYLKPKSDSYFAMKWAYYQLLDFDVNNIDSGTAIPSTSRDAFYAISVNVPPLPTQRKIAAILSTYDDLIENNTRRVAILEEMAQTLYREWFVHFRFPGHEQVAMVDSDLGPIPEGWEITRVSEVAEVYRGRSYRSADLVEENSLPFLNLKCVERYGGFRHDGLKRYAGRYKDTQKARPGDIIIAVTDMKQERRIVARAARVPDIGEETFVFSMDLVKVVPREDVPSDYLYGMLRFSRFPDEVKQYASGVNVLHLRPAHIEGFEFTLPPENLRKRYATLVSVAYKQCDALQKKNDLLRQTRDLLLPRLISGEVDVAGLDH